MNRRSFIKAAGTSAGTLAIGSGVDLNAGTGNRDSAASQTTQSAGSVITADVAVIGAGVMGQWTALNLREMGLSVVLIDQYGPGNSKSSSPDEVRGMRLTYGDNEHEMLWARDSCEQWKMREIEFGTKMFYQVGAMQMRREWTTRNRAERALFEKHKIPYEVIPYDDMVRRWPQAPPPSEEYFGFFHPWGGVLVPRDATGPSRGRSRTRAAPSFWVRRRPGRVRGQASDRDALIGRDRQRRVVRVLRGFVAAQSVPRGDEGQAHGGETRVLHDRHATWRQSLLRSEPPELVEWTAEHQWRRIGWLMGSGSTPVDPDNYEHLPNAEEQARIKRQVAESFPDLRISRSSSGGCVRPRSRSTGSTSSIPIRRWTTCGSSAAVPTTGTRLAPYSETMSHTGSSTSPRVCLPPTSARRRWRLSSRSSRRHSP